VGAAGGAPRARTAALPLDYGAAPGANATFFSNRFWVDDSHYSFDGPLFVYMGGEGPASGRGAPWVLELARRHGALVLALEHRFYGESLPAGGLSLENLPHLTADNALEDAARIVTLVQDEHRVGMGGRRPPTVAFGGSYSGALSAWFRMAYPELVDGALSSSGVVNARLDFPQFDMHIAEVLPADCLAALRAATAALDARPAPGKALFGLPADTPDADFQYMYADSAAMAVQYGSKDALCKAMAEGGSEPEKALADFTALHWGRDFAGSCFYSTSCLHLGPAQRWQPTARSWRWQKCTQLAYLQRAPAKGAVRSKHLDLKALELQCMQVFGPATEPNTSHINSRFGGARPYDTSNIFFTNFKDDPWVEAGVANAREASDHTCFADCDGCGHCQDLHAPTADDPEELQQCREKFAEAIAGWLPPAPTIRV